MRLRRPAVAGPPTAPAQRREVPESDSETENSEANEEPSSVEEIPAPAAYPVRQIRDRRDGQLGGIDEYLVRWEDTKHATVDLKISAYGDKLKVEVGGKHVGIAHQAVSTPDHLSDNPETIVKWADSWLTAWELPSAFTAMQDFEMRHPRPPPRTVKDQKPELSDWPLYLKDFRDPEPEPKMRSRGAIGDCIFEIEVDVDYTIPILRYCKNEVRIKGSLRSTAVSTLLCMPVRQRLVFNAEFVRAKEVFNGSQDVKWKALFVYVVGLAHRERCSHCDTDPSNLAFPLCVTWPGFFAGSCVNCVLTGKTTKCGCRKGLLNPLRWQSNAREIQLPESQDDAKNTESVSPGTQSGGSVGDGSSLGPGLDSNNFTPPSEHSTPTNRSLVDETSRDSLRADSDDASNKRTYSGESSGLSSIHVGMQSALLDESEADLTARMGRGSGVGGRDLDNADRHDGGEIISRSMGPAQETRPAARNRIVRAVQSTGGRFGEWSSPESNNGAPDQPAAGPSTKPQQTLSSRQLSKRPVARSIDTPPQTKRPRPEGVERERFWFKPETPPSESSSTEKPPEYDVSHHTYCSRRAGARCVDQTAGFVIPPFDKFSPPANVVYSNQTNFAAGGLDDDQVQFIISHCPCPRTEFLQKAWESQIAAKPSDRRKTKYEVLSNRYHDILNTLIRENCPDRPFWPDEEPIEID